MSSRLDRSDGRSDTRGCPVTADLHDASHELVRTALLARLAVDLDDQPLARRAALEAAAHARLLAGRMPARIPS